MKNTRLHIPVDICSEILCRLPVKSLLRFRCVSKSWLSLIDNHDFALLHFKNFNTNHEETQLLVVHDTQRTFVVRCSDTFEISSEPLLTLGRARREGSWDFVCSIDGLVLLKRVFGNGALGFSDLKVWNPSIRKFHEFPSLSEIETSPNTYSWDADIGLGYDQLANDYKHVKLIFSNGAWHSVAIYNLGTGSWKINKFQGKGLPGHWDQMSFEQGKKVYLRGSLYILLRDVDNYTDPELVSFDLSSEVVSSIGLPDEPCTYGFEGWKELVLIDDGCSVAVFDCDSIDKSVWVLESSRDGSEFMCWTKRYSFRLKYIHQFLYFKKSGDILTRRCRHETVTDETGKKSSVMWDRVASYNPETEEYKILEERKGSRYLIGHVSAYAESLILLR